MDSYHPLILYFFKISANDFPPLHTVAGAVTAPVPMKDSDSGFDDKLDFSSELASSVLRVNVVVFPVDEEELIRVISFCYAMNVRQGSIIEKRIKHKH